VHEDNLPAALHCLVESTTEAADMAHPSLGVSAFGMITADDHAKFRLNPPAA